MSATGVDVVVRGGRVVTSTDVVEAAVAIRDDKACLGWAAVDDRVGVQR